MIHHRWRRPTYFVLVSLITLFTTGYPFAMTSHHLFDGDGTIVKNTFPLKFKDHNFCAFYYNTIGCKVLHANMYDVRKGDDEVSPPPPPDYVKNLSASRSSIDNFPPLAVVTWRSLDGVQHEAKVDMAKIFKDRLILHNVDEKDIPANNYVRNSDIILVANDRTISVYMKAFIPLKEPYIPGNKYSSGRDELMLAYTHTY